MARKTRAQKRKADDRKATQPIAPYTQAAPTPLPTSDVALTDLSLDTKKLASESRLVTPNYPYLKKDLMKVGMLAVGAVALELVVSYAVTHGMLKGFGIL